MRMEIPDVVIRMTEEAVHIQDEWWLATSVEWVYKDAERLKYQIGEIVMAIIDRDYINKRRI